MFWRIVSGWSAFLPLREDVAQHHLITGAIGTVGFGHQFSAPGAVGFILGAIRVNLLCQLAEQAFEILRRGKRLLAMLGPILLGCTLEAFIFAS